MEACDPQEYFVYFKGRKRTAGTTEPAKADKHLQGLTTKLPASFSYAGDLTLVSQLTEADTAYAVVTQVSVGSAADLAAVVAAAGELGTSLLLQNHSFLSHYKSSSIKRGRERRADPAALWLPRRW